MQSRMERYNSSENTVKEPTGRAQRNQELYKNKDYKIYSSNETIIDTSNEVDITKIKDIIKNREDYQRAKSYRNMLNDKKFEIEEEEIVSEPVEEKDYDINTLLQKVKANKGINNDEDKVRKLRNTQYDILSKLDVKSKEKTLEEQKEDLKELINTITHQDPIKDDSTDLLSELIDDNTTMIKSAKELENELTKESIKKEAQKLQQTFDRTAEEKAFYSDSFTFSKKDFDDLKDFDENIRKGNKLIKFLIFILIVVIITVGLFVADSFFDFIPFI